MYFFSTREICDGKISASQGSSPILFSRVTVSICGHTVHFTFPYFSSKYLLLYQNSFYVTLHTISLILICYWNRTLVNFKYFSLFYKKYGISLPHSSRAQANYGKRIKASQAKPGDLFFYSKNGVINHVAIYIGNGQVIHASSAKTGIKISNSHYRTPTCVVSLLN